VCVSEPTGAPSMSRVIRKAVALAMMFPTLHADLLQDRKKKWLKQKHSFIGFPYPS
jgi:hypothetical protein